MSKDRLELKVGLFMVVCLALSAALAIMYSETSMGLKDGYPVVMETRSAGTLVRQANVVMSGVRIGYVGKVELTESGDGALIHLYIFNKYVLHKQDSFSVESVGLMGDQYVSVEAIEERGPKLKPGDHVKGKAPLSLEKIGEKAEGLVERVDRMVIKVDGMMGTFSNMVHRVDQELLDTDTLNNATAAIANVYSVSKDVKKFSEGMVEVTAQMTNIAHRGVKAAERVEGTAAQIESLVATNVPNISALFADLKQTTESMNSTVSRLEKMVGGAQPQLASVMANAAKTSEAVRRAAANIEQTVATNKVIVGQTLTNVQQLTGRLDKTAADIQKTVSANRENIDEIMANVKDVSENLKVATGNISKVVERFEKGKGFAGNLFKDDQGQMTNAFIQMATNFSHTALRLSTLASNLNEYGVLWKGEQSKRNPPNVFKGGKKRGNELQYKSRTNK